MDIEDLVKSIAKYVAKNSERESIFLTPAPEWYLGAHSLLDYIGSITGISKEQISKWTEEDRP